MVFVGDWAAVEQDSLDMDCLDTFLSQPIVTNRAVAIVV